MTYDHANLPISITRSSVTSTYRYNAESQRIAKRVGSGDTEVYLLEGRTALGVFNVNGSGTLTSWHFNILAGGKVVGRRTNAGVKRFYHTDLLGSTRAVVQGASIVESYDYDPWGVLMDGRTLAGPTKEGYTGKERDAETGLDYFGFRYYMSSVGRWTSVDPLADSFPSWSPYNYVENNPISSTDVLGLFRFFNVRCWLVVRALRKEAKQADNPAPFEVAAQAFAEYKEGNVVFVKKDDPRLIGDWGPGTVGGYVSEDGNVYINRDRGKGDQLVTAVHEGFHLAGYTHPDDPYSMERQNFRALEAEG